MPPKLLTGIEHIGSTAVEGLIAKPIIDMLLGLSDFERDAALLVRLMVEAGYRYNNTYEHIMPYRRFFQHNNHNLSYNIHAVAFESEFWTRHLLFRNYLRQFPDKRDLYAAHKITLAEQEWDDTGAYANAKTSFIRQLEQDAALYFARQNTKEK